MHEICEVPSGQFAAREHVNVVRVVLAKKLHSHHGKDEYDYTQYEGQVTQGAHSSTHDRDQQIQGWPRFSQFEHTEL